MDKGTPAVSSSEVVWEPLQASTRSWWSTKVWHDKLGNCIAIASLRIQLRFLLYIKNHHRLSSTTMISRSISHHCSKSILPSPPKPQYAYPGCSTHHERRILPGVHVGVCIGGAEKCKPNCERPYWRRRPPLKEICVCRVFNQPTETGFSWGLTHRSGARR